jgi:nucleotide-binding universal stress UspA family protein
MSSLAIFLIGVFAVLMLAIFVYVSIHEVRVSPAGVMPFRGLLPMEEHVADLEKPTKRALRVVVATDGSPCSDRAVQSVAARPWPAGSQIEVVSVVHTRVPAVPDLELMVEAVHVDTLAADRERAPAQVERAVRGLGEVKDVWVTGKVLEGVPEDAILEEAERWQADLIVLGSHGFGPVKRRLLGSVSQALALHAPCSVEIVRCAHPAVV